MKTPVLFLGFNRPDLAEKVLKRLRQCGVEEIHFALDGPRPDREEDRDKCAQMRALVEGADWVQRKRVLAREENLGCGRAVSSAISWFFEDVAAGIIVEDDCLPDPSFFTFCETMLERHATDAAVWSVAGTTLLPDCISVRASHYFSKYMGIWGWATWRRAWQSYDFDFSSRTPDEWRALVSGKSADAIERAYWLHLLDLMMEGKIDTWDFQVQFSSWKADGVHLTSSRNLVENLGFRPDATHTTQASPLTERMVEENLPPYDQVPLEPNHAIDRIVRAEKLRASRELVDWLFGPEREKELERQLETLRSRLAEAQAQRDGLRSEKQRLEGELAKLVSELSSRRGLRGALRALVAK